MPLLLATMNAHKVEEIRAILARAGLQEEVRCLADYPDLPEPPEDQESFIGNALQKARFIHERVGLPTIADDSGIVVDALDGAPGVHSKRYTPEQTALSNNQRLLRELAERPNAPRTARFTCAMALVTEQGERVMEGHCEGQIAEALSGEGGFGYDPLFLPEEAPGRSMAQLSREEKNAISHRGRAFAQLPALLAELQVI